MVNVSFMVGNTFTQYIYNVIADATLIFDQQEHISQQKLFICRKWEFNDSTMNNENIYKEKNLYTFVSIHIFVLYTVFAT